jgi:anti-anti-sigma regulatory factor
VHTTTTHHGGQLKLLNLSKRLTDLLVVTKLATVFDSYEDEKEALASYK